MQTDTAEKIASELTVPEQAALKMGRLSSLDALRGLALTGMIMVNTPGTEKHVYNILNHVPWNGWVPADLIFASFIFMVGVSIAFAYSKHLAQGTPRFVYGDDGRLRQVLINLARNAVKFTEQGGIEIRTETEALLSGDIRIRCSVIDSGIGVSDATRERLFHSFSQGDASTSRKYGGIVVVNIDGMHVGLVVDTISEVRNIEENTISPAPINSPAYIKGMAKIGDALVILLEGKRILQEHELASLS